MEVAAWWLVYGRSPTFKVHSTMIPSVVEVVAEREDIGVAEATDKAEDAQTRSFQMRSSWASGRRKRSSQSGGDKVPPNREEADVVVAKAPEKAEDEQTRSFHCKLINSVCNDSSQLDPVITDTNCRFCKDD